MLTRIPGLWQFLYENDISLFYAIILLWISEINGSIQEYILFQWQIWNDLRVGCQPL